MSERTGHGVAPNPQSPPQPLDAQMQDMGLQIKETMTDMPLSK